MISGKTVLVTGGAGYIGSHACKALAAAGYTPVAFDSLIHGNRQAVLWGTLEVGDIADRARLDAALALHCPVAVMHFAAFTDVLASIRDPDRYYRNNVAGSLTLLEAMRDHRIPSLVFSSTCATYGLPQAVAIDEDHPQQPISPYGSGKLMIERMLQYFSQAHGLRSISLRCFNAAGADPVAEIGESHDPETHLIPLALDAATGRRGPLQVHGTDYDTPDGTCIRDYVHVSDIAQAHLLALEALLGGAGGGAYNLGNGQGFSVREVIDCVRAVTGRTLPVVEGPRRTGDPSRLVGDASRIHRELGWSPRYAELSTIVATAWRWHQRAA